MLHLLNFKSTLEAEEIVLSTDPVKDCWLVADIKSKLEIQNQFKKSYGGFVGTSVLRISELWRDFFQKLYPDQEVISDIVLKTILRDWLLAEYPELPIGSDSLLIEALKLFYPMVRSQHNIETLQEWVDAQDLSNPIWFSYCVYGERFLRHLRSQSRVPQFALVHELLDVELHAENAQILKSSFLARTLWVDLGLEMSTYESELLQRLSSIFEIKVLLGDVYRNQKYEISLKPYQDLSAFLSTNLNLSGEKHKAKIQTFKFSSQLTESIWVIQKIQELSRQGISYNEIGVFADQIEPYWSLLSELSKQYYIPFAKAITFRTSTLPTCQKWIAKLKVQAGESSYSMLEQGFFENNSHIVHRQSEYFAQLSELLDFTDLKNRKIGRTLESVLQTSDQEKDVKVSRSDFASILIREIKEVQNCSDDAFFDSVTDLVYNLLSDFKSDEKLLMSSWVFWLEETLNKYEVKMTEADPKGVTCANLSSLNSVSLKFVFVLGSTESSFKDVEYSLVPTSILSKLSRELGIDYRPISQRKECEVVACLSQPEVTTFLCYPLTQVDGRENNPAGIWIELDQGASHGQTQPVRTPKAIKTLGVSKFEAVPWSAPFNWSASKVSDFKRCPFVFAAKNIFKIEDPEIIDLDLGARGQGSFKHLVLQKLSEEPFRSNWSDQELDQLFDSCLDDLDIQGLTSEIWKLKKLQTLGFARRYLAAEKDFRSSQPGHKVIAAEQRFQFEYCGIKITGSIDRVDQTSDGRYHVIDYKSSDGSLFSADKWVAKQSLQIPFYIKALETLYPDFKINDHFGSAYYLVYKDMTRIKGIYHEKAFNLDVGSCWNTEQVENLLHDAMEEVLRIDRIVRAGQWEPLPDKKEDCVTCRWRKVCRATHLN